MRECNVDYLTAEDRQPGIREQPATIQPHANAFPSFFIHECTDAGRRLRPKTTAPRRLSVAQNSRIASQFVYSFKKKIKKLIKNLIKKKKIFFKFKKNLVFFFFSNEFL